MSEEKALAARINSLAEQRKEARKAFETSDRALADEIDTLVEQRRVELKKQKDVILCDFCSGIVTKQHDGFRCTECGALADLPVVFNAIPCKICGGVAHRYPRYFKCSKCGAEADLLVMIFTPKEEFPRSTTKLSKDELLSRMEHHKEESER